MLGCGFEKSYAILVYNLLKSLLLQIKKQ